jgi:hypothetical protein
LRICGFALNASSPEEQQLAGDLQAGVVDTLALLLRTAFARGQQTWSLLAMAERQACSELCGDGFESTWFAGRPIGDSWAAQQEMLMKVLIASAFVVAIQRMPLETEFVSFMQTRLCSLAGAISETTPSVVKRQMMTVLMIVCRRTTELGSSAAAQTVVACLGSLLDDAQSGPLSLMRPSDRAELLKLWSAVQAMATAK